MLMSDSIGNTTSHTDQTFQAENTTETQVGTPNEINLNGQHYRTVNMAVLYTHPHTHTSCNDALVDRGANVAIFGSDVCVKFTTSRSVDIHGIDPDYK